MVLFNVISVLQMSVLEVEDAGNGTPQGVVLAVVGPSHDSPTISRDHENIRTVRMYNLASLISLARWTIAHKVNKARKCSTLKFKCILGHEAGRHAKDSCLATSLTT